MTGTELFRLVLATYGYPRICDGVSGVFERKEEALKVARLAPGAITENTVGLGWPRWWRIVRTDIEEHDELRGVVVAGCVPAEEQG